MSERLELKGARWSSAVRCIAKAEYQALGVKGDEAAQDFLIDAFVRGVNAADAWIASQAQLSFDQGKTLVAEQPIPWGPDGIWTGHADAILLEDEVVVEAYHAVGGVFREEKALQAAGYALRLGDGARAMLAVLDTTDVDEDEGFAVTMYPIDVEGLRPQVEAIEQAVTRAYLAGAVNPADKVGDTPMHRECQGCQFREPCWEGWVPPDPVEVPDLELHLSKLATLRSERSHVRARTKELDEEIDSYQDEIRPYALPGIPVRAGGVEVVRKVMAPRTSFRLSAYLKAGHPLTYPMESFVSESEHEGERWSVVRFG